MKKLFAFLFALCMLAGVMAGCTVGEDTPLSGGNSGGNNGGTTKLDVTVEETVLYNENDVTVTVTGLSSGFMGQEIKLRIENNSDKNVALSGSKFIVNGFMISGNMHIEAAAGKKSNDTLVLYSTDLELAGIEHIATCSTYGANLIDSDTYKTIADITLDIRTSIADTYEQAIDDSGDVLFQQDGITVIAKKLSDGLLGKSVVLMVKNETGKDIYFHAENVSVNDYTVTTFVYDQIAKDTISFASIDLLSSELEENEITTIEEVTFTAKILDVNSLKEITASDELKVVVNG